MIKKIAEYHIHNETARFNHLREKSGNFTLKAEGRFCEKMEKETRKLLDELSTMSAGDSYECRFLAGEKDGILFCPHGGNNRICIS